MSALQAPTVTWGNPEVVWESSGLVSDPVLLADAYGRAHLFFVDVDDASNNRMLYHMDAMDAGGEAKDVQVVGSQIRLTADGAGQIHLLNQLGGSNLQYSSVDAAQAGDAGAWAPSLTVASSPAGAGAAIAAGAHRSLYICYPQDQTVRYIRSDDLGASWGEEQTVSQTTDAEAIATHVRCAEDGAGRLHVAWVEARPPSFYPSDRVLVTRSDADQLFWDEPEEVAGIHYSVPTLIADGRGRVHLAWQGDVGVGGRFYRQRADGGGPWSAEETMLPAGNGGLSGDLPLALDSLGRVHAAVATTRGIAWVGRGQGWTAPTQLSGSLEALPNTSGSIERPALTVAHGNEVKAAFVFDGKRLYLMSGQTDAPVSQPTPASAVAQPVVSLRAVESGAAPGDDATAIPTDPDAQALPVDALVGGSGSLTHLPIVLGGVLALTVVAWGLWGRARRIRRR